MMQKQVNGIKINLTFDEEKKILGEWEENSKKQKKFLVHEKEKKEKKNLALKKICETCNLSEEEIKLVFQT